MPATTEPVEMSPWRIVDIGGAQGVVTSGTELGWDVIVGDEWTAADEDLQAFERALPVALLEQGLGDMASRLDEYTRWYSAVEVGNEPALLVWLSCVADADAFLDRIPFVDDGGDCFFSVTFDPSDMTVRRISVNGEA